MQRFAATEWIFMVEDVAEGEAHRLPLLRAFIIE